MLPQRVSVPASSDQSFFSLAIAGLSSALSMWLTLRFCHQLWPEEAGGLLLLMGLAWEGAKLHFGPIALSSVRSGTLSQRFGGLALGAMVLVLMIGSVLASMACFSRASSRTHQQELEGSQLYNDARKPVDDLDAEIKLRLAERDAADDMRTPPVSG